MFLWNVPSLQPLSRTARSKAARRRWLTGGHLEAGSSVGRKTPANERRAMRRGAGFGFSERRMNLLPLANT